MFVPPRPALPTTRRATRLIGRAAISCTLGLAGTVAACAGGGDVTGTPSPTPSPSSSLSLAAAPAAVRVQAGQSATATVRLTRGGSVAAVSLGAAVGGAPAGVAAAFAPATVPADGAESAVTLTTTATTPAGDYTVTISGSGGASASTTVTLHVDPAPVARYALAVTPTPIAVTAGAAAAGATVTLARSHFAGAVALAAAGAPAGLTVTVPSAPLAGDSAALSVQAAATVPAGDYPVTLTGSAAGLAPVTATVVVRVAAAPPPPPPAGVTPGYVTGTVVDGAGRPLAGVRVYAKNTLLYNTNAIGVTDAQGRYRLDVREPIGTWRVTAQLRREYEGHMYTLDLHPENDEPAPFPGVDGAVRNFSWRVGGRTPAGGYYGGRVYVRGIPGGWMNDVEHEDMELEFTPVGPLIDGSTGAARTLRGGVGPEADHVPLGKYRVTAWAAPAGAARRRAVLRVSIAGAPYADEVVVTWPVDLNGWAKRLEFDVAAPQ